jgi:hypothetical protein
LSRGNNPFTIPTKEAEAKAVKDEGQKEQPKVNLAKTYQKPKAKSQEPKTASLIYPRSASASSLPRLGLCLSFLACFLFSARFTGGGVPNTARDAAFTALVAVNFLSFFFFGTILF